LIMLPSETMIWQPEFTDKTLSRKPGAVQIALQQTWSGDFMRLLDQNRLSSQILLIPSLLEKFNSEII
ncbi:hypothetical protein L3W76_20600, partial [Escherichia coli]